MLSYIAEFLRIMILIILGDDVIASVTLSKSGMKGVGSTQITFAWSLTVMLSALILGVAFGAHLNPALTTTLVVDESTSWGLVPGYIVAQFAGAFVGVVTVYLLLKDQYDVIESMTARPGTLYTGPSVPNTGRNTLSEVVGIFMLVFVIKGVGQVLSIALGMSKLLVFGIIIFIGMSLGGLAGYAINPARDLGPCLARVVLPTKGKGDSNWGYTPIAIIGPVVGAAVVALLHQAVP